MVMRQLHLLLVVCYVLQKHGALRVRSWDHAHVALHGGHDGRGCSCPHTDGPSAPAEPPRAPQGATDLAA